MSRGYESTRVLRGVEVEVYAMDFEEAFPTCIGAKTEDGKDFELTPAEEEEISLAAHEWYCDPGDYNDNYF